MSPLRLVRRSDKANLLTLRHLELVAYASVISAFRAEGNLSEDKLQLLAHLRSILGIHSQRHKAEIRRAISDEKLTTIAFMLHGSKCSKSWYREGRRLVGVLKRATPQNHYTSLANKVAKETAEENAQLEQTDADVERESQELVSIRQASRSATDAILSPLQDPQTQDAATSTDDLAKECSKANDNYVYLPGGTVVQLSPNDVSRDVNEPDSKLTTNDFEEGAKRRRLSASTDEPSYSIKEVFRSSDIESYRKKKNSPVKRPVQAVIAPDPVPVCLPVTAPVQVPSSFSDQQNQAMFAQREEVNPVTTIYTSTLHPIPPEVLKFKSLKGGRVRKEQMFHKPVPSSEACSTSIIPQAPVPPEHLYAVSASTRVASTTSTQSESWATKHNVASIKKAKRRAQGPLLPRRRKASMSPGYQRTQEAYTDLTTKEDALVVKPAPGHKRFASDFRPTQVSDEHAVLANERFRKDSPPQKVFMAPMRRRFFPRPEKFQMTEPSKERSTPERRVATTVETGLAPVSAIVSRMSSPAESLTDSISMSDDPQPQVVPSAADKAKVVQHGTGNLTKSTFKPKQTSKMFHNTASFLPSTMTTLPFEPSSKSTDASLPTMKEGDTKLPSFITDRPTVKTSSPLIQKDVIRSKVDTVQSLGRVLTLHDKAVVKDPPPIPAKPPQTSSATQAVVSHMENKLITGAGKPLAVVKSSSSTISSSSIFKVTPRPLTSAKALPVVTRIPGKSQPNIIVVHRPPSGNTTSATPAKYLEIGGKGASKPVTHIKTLPGDNTRPVASVSINSRQLVKPVTTKLVNVSTNVRTVAGKPVASLPAGSIHKVITKGKMQQLVLKPSASIVPPTGHLMTSRATSKPTQVATYSALLRPPLADESGPEQTGATRDVKAVPVHSAGKPLMTIQMSLAQSSPSLVTTSKTMMASPSTNFTPTFSPRQQMTISLDQRSKPVVFTSKPKSKFITIDSSARSTGETPPRSPGE